MRERKRQDRPLERRLLQLGALLLLLGLLSGFGMAFYENPRMGLSSHLEGVLNGILLMVLGVLWPRLALSRRLAGTAFALAVYGGFANWTATLLAALWGAGRSMPIAAGGLQGVGWQEGVIDLLLYSLSFAMVGVCALVLWGLRRAPRARSAEAAELSRTRRLQRA